MMQQKAIALAVKFRDDYNQAARSGRFSAEELEDALEDAGVVNDWIRKATEAYLKNRMNQAYELFFKSAVISRQLSRQLTGQYR